ncbi:extracellular solute-binding protein [Streptomyces althioticus]|uniref:extracellular solute-binding protein n=1 Tax=Streptomyces althioticus TaxID=83380 RepID=UPI00081B0283|nr:Binding-protein-dependent transport system inner membrane component [Streptomyces sp. di50b]SCE45440.1 Binding-protein-dependent transport system inner membrane component [Streptomyces sp. di188]
MRQGKVVERRTVLKAAGASLAVTGLGTTATACGGGSGSGDGTVTIRYAWWGAADRAQRINKTIDLFEKKHPKIKVKTDFQPYTDFWKKFNTQASGGNPPDVFQNAVGFLRKYDAKNVLLDLHEQVKAGHLRVEGFQAGLEKFGEIDGKLLGVPVGSNSMALVIDKPVYARAGITPEMGGTWDDFDEAMARVRDRTGRAGDSGMYGVTEAFFVFLMVQFMRNLPRELDEAARLDGCGHLRFYWSIVLPLCRPALVTSAIFTSINAWNDFMGPLIYLNEPGTYTVSLGLKMFVDQEGLANCGGMIAIRWSRSCPCRPSSSPSSGTSSTAWRPPD